MEGEDSDSDEEAGADAKAKQAKTVEPEHPELRIITFVGLYLFIYFSGNSVNIFLEVVNEVWLRD